MQLSTKNIIFVVTAITIIFLLVAVFIVMYVRLYNLRKKKHMEEKDRMASEFEAQLVQSQAEVQEQTFQQIGKELHDNVGQLLSTSRMLLGLTERSMTNPPDTLLTANATLADAISELRSLSKSLDKEWLEQFSFIDNLKTEITRINTGGVVQAEFIYSDHIPLPSDGQIILFRIVQEAVQNAIKHANPKKINIHVSQNESRVYISVADDGNGFSLAEIAGGQGLVNMKHRTQLLGGSIVWQPGPEEGTIVTISLPIKPDSV